MASIRHKQSRRRRTPERTSYDAALDAARDCVLAVGVRRTTLTDIARRAGVSRMTLYRRWPDVRSLVADLMTREFVVLARDVVRIGDGRPAGPAVVDSLVNGVRAFRAHPLFRKIIDVDPELLLPYLLERRGTSQDEMLRLLEQDLRAGHADGSIRPGDVVRQTRAVLLVVQSFVISAHTMTDEGAGSAADDLDDELRRILERYLLP